MNKKTKDEIKLARQCLNFTNINCKNKDCKAVYCPLNKKGDYV